MIGWRILTGGVLLLGAAALFVFYERDTSDDMTSPPSSEALRRFASKNYRPFWKHPTTSKVDTASVVIAPTNQPLPSVEARAAASAAFAQAIKNAQAAMLKKDYETATLALLSTRHPEASPQTAEEKNEYKNTLRNLLVKLSDAAERGDVKAQGLLEKIRTARRQP